ncbi:hypothetical protein LOTGIDRAFT_163239 [Lottia gigantea]|uniref:Uncharacterized protein n=1 Tax=Lottia gigantea TaxID=225164 RepID=V4A5C3_LOTGI|nr:hypothetical protein LOTGIDRAFT_163239 [Lottia gigantea]ESO91877.1 hypothetical protein LOTGIDRAFT_163239 [Lottia gigantea]
MASTKGSSSKGMKTENILCLLILSSQLIAICGDVEQNPGPLSTRQGQISKSGEVVYPTPTDNVIELTSLVQSLKADISNLRSEIKDLKDEVKDLNIKEEVIKIREEVTELKMDSKSMKSKIDSTENREKQKNLILYGVKEVVEGVEDCEKLCLINILLTVVFKEILMVNTHVLHTMALV